MLEQGGLDRERIRQWLTVCWPSQVQAVMDDWPHYGPEDWFKIGMNGARGFKAGVRRSRELEAARLWATQRETRNNDIQRALRTFEPGALEDEFL